jgi:hypothetical protein
MRFSICGKYNRVTCEIFLGFGLRGLLLLKGRYWWRLLGSAFSHGYQYHTFCFKEFIMKTRFMKFKLVNLIGSLIYRL